jgi:hypothetical protein
METSTERPIATLDTWTDELLAERIEESAARLNVLSRQAQHELRHCLIPMLREVRERFKAGRTVAGCSGVQQFYRSIGLNPSTVRTWELRAREAEKLIDDLEAESGNSQSFVERNVSRVERILDSKALNASMQEAIARSSTSLTTLDRYASERKRLAFKLRAKAEEFNRLASAIESGETLAEWGDTRTAESGKGGTVLQFVSAAVSQ